MQGRKTVRGIQGHHQVKPSCKCQPAVVIGSWFVVLGQWVRAGRGDGYSIIVIGSALVIGETPKAMRRKATREEKARLLMMSRVYLGEIRA